MGKRYEQHSDMCGCERCALQYETDSPRPVYDMVDDPNWCTYCQNPLDHCTCAEWPDYDGEEEE